MLVRLILLIDLMGLIDLLVILDMVKVEFCLIILLAEELYLSFSLRHIDLWDCIFQRIPWQLSVLNPQFVS